MREVGAFEAKNKLGQLLDLVERGEEVIITRHGKEVARLVPPKEPSTATRHGRRYAASVSAPRNLSSVPSSGPNGNPTGPRAGREPGARQLGRAREDLRRGDHGGGASDT